MNERSRIAHLDRESTLHPFTQLKDFGTAKLGDPTIIETAQGIRITDQHGKSLIDGFAGLNCVNIGYGRTEVAEAIARQAYRLAYFETHLHLDMLMFVGARDYIPCANSDWRLSYA